MSLQVHGYFEWDWADCYRQIGGVGQGPDKNVQLQMDHDVSPKSNARFYVTNVLAELDAPGARTIRTLFTPLFTPPFMPLFTRHMRQGSSTSTRPRTPST